eukprot:scaffold251216_cov15-Tisochrysis_lutea.AAC.1
MHASCSALPICASCSPGLSAAATAGESAAAAPVGGLAGASAAPAGELEGTPAVGACVQRLRCSTNSPPHLQPLNPKPVCSVGAAECGGTGAGAAATAAAADGTQARPNVGARANPGVGAPPTPDVVA